MDSFSPLNHDQMCFPFVNIFCNIFVRDRHSGIECTTSKTADDTQLKVVIEMQEGRDTIQRHLDRLERWALVGFSKANWKVLNPN